MTSRISTTIFLSALFVASGSITFGQAPRATPPKAAPAQTRRPAPAAPAAAPKAAVAPKAAAAPVAPAALAPPQPKKLERADIVNSETTQEFEKKDRIAVVAAVGRYSTDLSPLQFTMADAVELSAEFKRQGYTVFTLLNNEATADNIRLRLEAIAQQIQPKDGTLVFAFSGHGFQNTEGKNFLATYGTTLESLEQTGLGVSEVETLMKGSGARRSVMLIDACRSVPGVRDVSAPRSFQSFSDSEGVSILLSTRPGGFSYEDPSLQHGIFSNFVLDALRGKAAKADGKISFGDLAAYVEENVLNYASARNLIQKPFRTGGDSGYSGDFLIATGTPLKEDEVEKAKEESGSRNITNDSVLLKRQGGMDSFMVVPKDNGLYLYQIPTMQPFASMTLTPAEGLTANQRRYEGKAGTGNQTIHVVATFDGETPLELSGRIGIPCQGVCAGQDLRLPGEGVTVTNTAVKAEEAATGAKRVLGGILGRRGNQAVDTTQKASGVVRALDGKSWTAFNLLPEQKLK